jgi:hypothetical protein
MPARRWSPTTRRRRRRRRTIMVMTMTSSDFLPSFLFLVFVAKGGEIEGEGYIFSSPWIEELVYYMSYPLLV